MGRVLACALVAQEGGFQSREIRLSVAGSFPLQLKKLKHTPTVERQLQ